MAKISQKKNASSNDTSDKKPVISKAKRTRKTVQRDSPPQRSSIYRGVTRYAFLQSGSFWVVLRVNLTSFHSTCEGIDGLVDMKLICGIRIVGMNHKTKKDDKVFISFFLKFVIIINSWFQFVSWILLFKFLIRISFWIDFSWKWWRFLQYI